MHYFLKLIFGIKLYMFRTVPLSIISRFFTVHTAVVQRSSNMTGTDVARFTHKQSRSYLNHLVYVIQLVSRIRTEFHPDPARKLSENLYDIHHCCVYSEITPDDGQRNCPKHEEFYSKNKFEK